MSKIYTETEQFSPTSILSAGNAIILKGAPKTPKAKPAKIPRPSIETLAVIETDNLSVHNDTAKANMTRDIFVGAQNDNSDGTANDTQADTQIAKPQRRSKPTILCKMRFCTLHRPQFSCRAIHLSLQRTHLTQSSERRANTRIRTRLRALYAIMNFFSAECSDKTYTRIQMPQLPKRRYRHGRTRKKSPPCRQTCRTHLK